ncbi:MAG: carboxypeptidase-like regulatory domain-containing protein [Calditrichaeota bacterium]|nr:carboxypeptidase-like regulatory domain-containing protein [Calditrichota bacterium]
MKCKIFLAIVLSFSLMTPLIWAQDDASISGIITDKRTGDPLPGTNVFVKGTTVGAASAQDGSFVINNITPGTYTLVASFIGYHTEATEVQVNVGETVTADFSMREDVFRTEDIVVTGIANQRSRSRSEVAVGTVDVVEMTQKQNYTSFDQLINGKLAGVQVASSSGSVASGFRFHIRAGGGLNGNGQPIIYIDGVRVDNSVMEPTFTGGQEVGTLSTLNPDDIASIDFLKGPAAAASYGTNGSNGVVLITTKRGQINPTARGNLSVNYKLTAGKNTVPFEYSSSEYVSADAANAVHHDGDIRQHNFNISGGNSFIKYYTSFETRDEEGIMVNDKLDRTNLRANIDFFPRDDFNFSVTAGFSSSNALLTQNDNNTRGWLGNTLLFASSYVFTDSLSIANLRDESDTDRFIGSVQGSWTPIKNFEANFSLGIDNTDTRWDQFLRSDLDYGGVVNGERTIWDRRNKQLSFDLNARYSYRLANIDLTSVVGTQIFDRERRTAFLEVQNFSTPLITDAGAGADVTDKDETKLHIREAGVFTTHQLSYEDTYFMTLGLRNDFASAVGRDAPDIFYPQASTAIRLDKFNFLPTSIPLLKLRAAYGETGILPGNIDGIPLLWTAETGGYGAGAVLDAIGNLEIEPERVKELEFGFETEFLNNYALEFTYYRQTARESIIDFRNAPSSGLIASAVPINIGEIKGWGIETLLQATPIRTRNFQLDLSLVNSWNKNEVTDLGGAQPIFDGFDVNVTKEGLPNHEFYVLDVVGALFNDDGTYKGPDVTEDRVALGNPIPEYTGSFSLNLNLFKNLNLYALADWATGHSVYNLTKLFAVRFSNNPEANRLDYQLGVSDTAPEGEEGLTVFTPGTSEYNTAAVQRAKLDRNVDGNFIEAADFLKIREIAVNYNLTGLINKINSPARIRRLVVGFSARNIFTSTKYSGPDPEVNWAGARSLNRGQDFLTLQHPRVFTFFLQVGI